MLPFSAGSGAGYPSAQGQSSLRAALWPLRGYSGLLQCRLHGSGGNPVGPSFWPTLPLWSPLQLGVLLFFSLVF